MSEGLIMQINFTFIAGWMISFFLAYIDDS